MLTPALTATEAMQAIERAAEPFDLLICDQRLPDGAGLDIIERAFQQGMARYAIVLSGLDNAQLRAIEQLAVQRGLPLLGCLGKPCTVLTLPNCWSPAFREAEPLKHAGMKTITRLRRL